MDTLLQLQLLSWSLSQCTVAETLCLYFLYYIQIEPYRLDTTIECRICPININILLNIVQVCEIYK